MGARSAKALVAAAALVAASTVSGHTLVQAAPGARPAAAAPVGTDWPAYERNAGHSSAIFGDPAITTANAGSLHRAWSFLADAATMTGQPARQFDASPTVVGGRVVHRLAHRHVLRPQRSDRRPGLEATARLRLRCQLRRQGHRRHRDGRRRTRRPAL